MGLRTSSSSGMGHVGTEGSAVSCGFGNHDLSVACVSVKVKEEGRPINAVDSFAHAKDKVRFWYCLPAEAKVVDTKAKWTVHFEL